MADGAYIVVMMIILKQFFTVKGTEYDDWHDVQNLYKKSMLAIFEKSGVDDNDANDDDDDSISKVGSIDNRFCCDKNGLYYNEEGETMMMVVLVLVMTINCQS